jgi:YhcH/YjgK/YiaL family protein
MIVDNIKNAEFYYGLGDKFQKAFEFLKNTDLVALANGKYQIEGDDIFATVQEYQTKPESEGKFEAHRKYIDVQYIAKGHEKLGYVNIAAFSPVGDFDEEKDIVFGEGQGIFVQAKEGDFVIFAPQDAHMPCISDDAPCAVKKVIVKIKY